MKKIKEFLLQDSVVGYLFVLPLIIVVLGLMAYPFFNGVALSFTEKMVGYPSRFVGIKHYIYLAQDWIFRKTVANSFIYTGGAVTVKLILGMIMAISLNQALRGMRFFRAYFLVPWVAPTVVAALMWVWMFSGSKGIINLVLSDIGIIKENIMWLSNPTLALVSIIIANIWRGFPFFGVSLLAGLQAIPHEHYEVAQIDGASHIQQFVHITLPGLRYVIGITVLLSSVLTLNDFALVWVMTKGGPARATNIFATYAYQTAFQELHWGRALAISIYVLPILIVAIVLYSHYTLKGGEK